MTRCIISLSLLVVSFGIVHAQAPNADLDKIYADWKARQDKYKSVRYEIEGKRTLTKYWYNSHRDKDDPVKAMPTETIDEPLKRSVLVDCEAGGYRIQSEEGSYDPNTIVDPENWTTR
jgi:hypothetical protein